MHFLALIDLASFYANKCIPLNEAKLPRSIQGDKDLLSTSGLKANTSTDAIDPNISLKHTLWSSFTLQIKTTFRAHSLLHLSPLT